LVLTNGMHLGYGGNPYGPAGTGKTESVKALGQVCRSCSLFCLLLVGVGVCVEIIFHSHYYIANY
jgi:hypothetical protein